jgi:ABC-type multidrug transport system fused ATPase/permease subunit
MATNSVSTLSVCCSDLEKLHEGIGDSVAVAVVLVASTISSVIVAFIKGWKLTLVILIFMPIIIIAQALVAKVWKLSRFLKSKSVFMLMKELQLDADARITCCKDVQTLLCW